MQKHNPILEKDIELLETSEEFLLMAKQNKFRTLADIAEHPVTELMRKPGMNYRMLAELGRILKRHDLMEIIDED